MCSNNNPIPLLTTHHPPLRAPLLCNPLPHVQAIEQFCNDAEEARSQLRQSEERVASLSEDLMNRFGVGVPQLRVSQRPDSPAPLGVWSPEGRLCQFSEERLGTRRIMAWGGGQRGEGPPAGLPLCLCTDQVGDLPCGNHGVPSE